MIHRPFLRSFRVRITLLSTLLSAAVLLAFGVWAWNAVQRAGLARVDQTIRDLGDRHLNTRQGRMHWEYVSNSLEFVLGELRHDPFIMLVIGRNGDVIRQSANWPAELATDTFPTPIEAGFTEDLEPRDGPGNRRFHGDRMDFSEPPPEPPSPEPQNSTGGQPQPADNKPDGQAPSALGQPGAPGEQAPKPENGERGGPRQNRFGRPPGDARRNEEGLSRRVPPLHGQGDMFGDRPPQGGPFMQDWPGPPGEPPPLDRNGPFGFGPPPLPNPMTIRAERIRTVECGGRTWRLGVMSNPEVTLVLGLNLAPHQGEMHRLGALFLMAAPAALLLIALGGWWLAHRALRPVVALTRTAERVTARALDQRIPAGQQDAEFDRLIRVFNGMLDRLEKSFHQAVRFSADAAHELKTPLTILQGELAQAVQSAPSGSEQQQVLNRLLEEVQRLKSITRKLLLLALADSGRLAPQTQPVDLSAVVEEVGEDAEILAGGLAVQRDVEPGIWVNADPDLLRQVTQNLISNAVKYNVSGGKIAIRLARSGNSTRFTVANTGPGIPASDRERVFERFYRADKSRNRRVDGTGLGLSLAREIVRAHHGELVLENAQPGWTAFSVILPAIRPPEEPAATTPA